MRRIISTAHALNYDRVCSVCEQAIEWHAILTRSAGLGAHVYGSCRCGDCLWHQEERGGRWERPTMAMACHHCAVTQDRPARAVTMAHWVSETEEVSAEVYPVCDACLHAGNPDGPGYRPVAKEEYR